MRYISFSRVKELVSMARCLDLLGWVASKREPAGDRGPCPVHGSRSPGSRSLSVSAEGWYCHACKQAGDQISLWARLHGLPALEAAADLCRAAGVPIPFAPRRERKARSRRQQ